MPSDGTLGHVTYLEPPAWFRPDGPIDLKHQLLLTQWVDTALAGGIAEGLHVGLDNVSETKSYAGDLQAVADVALHMHGDHRVATRFVDYRLAVVTQRLGSPPNWDAVIAVAKALIARRTLKSRAIRRVIQLSCITPSRAT